jgi:hypothetical protein
MVVSRVSASGTAGVPFLSSCFVFWMLIIVPTSVDSSMIPKILSRAWRQAIREQKVEDVNVLYKFKNYLCRDLIALPLDDTFCQNRASEMYGKLQYSDKCSLPASLGKYIFENTLEPPWLFELCTVPKQTEHIESDDTTEEIEDDDDGELDGDNDDVSVGASNPAMILRSSLSTNKETPAQNDGQSVSQRLSQTAYCSPLDFRAPENYVFMPSWLMKHLRINANDVVKVKFVRMKLASLVTLEPRTLQWDKLLKKIRGDPKTLLEHEINKFSTLTTGSTIHIEINKQEYPFHVKSIKAEGDIDVNGARIQDSDVRVDIDRAYLDSLAGSRS